MLLSEVRYIKRVGAQREHRVLGRRFLEANGEILKPRKIRRKRRKLRRFWGFQKKIFLGLNRRFKNAVFYGVLKRRFGVFEKKKSPVP